jgi:hypothetical protein
LISKARRIKFQIDKIFPLDEPQSVPLLRLMMASNDVRHLQKLLLSANERAKTASDIERSILNGEISHLLKLLCGHLYEAGNAFRNFEGKCAGLLDAATAKDEDRKADLIYLRQVYAKTTAGAFHYNFLKPIRDYFGFHYKERQLREELERHIKANDLEGNLIVVEYEGLGRYSVSDHLAASAAQQLLGATPDNFQQKFAEAMFEAVKVGQALFQVVDHLLFHIFRIRKDAIIDEQDGEVTVPPELLRATEAATKK